MVTQVLSKSLMSLDEYKIIITKGEKGSWEESGVRDPAILMDENGIPYKINNKMVMYYTGSKDNCSIQSTGCAFSEDGKKWIKCDNNPVISPIPNSFESKIASTPWAIRNLKDEILLYYRSSDGIDDSVSVAFSKDGMNFDRYPLNPILTSEDFFDIPKGSVLGVINCAILSNGNYLLTFEAHSNKYGFAQIFGAISENGLSFKALNNGYPLLTCEDIVSWPVKRVCNPRVTVIKDEVILGFNAHYENGHYAIGFVSSKDLKNWNNFVPNPVLLPCESPIEHPLSGRLEGPVILFKDRNKTQLDNMIIMSIPQKGPSHLNAVIVSFYPLSNKIEIPKWLHKTVNSKISFSLDKKKYILNVDKKDQTKSNKIFIDSSQINRAILIDLNGVNFNLWVGKEYNTKRNEQSKYYEVKDNNIFIKNFIFKRFLSKKFILRLENRFKKLSGLLYFTYKQKFSSFHELELEKQVLKINHSSKIITIELFEGNICIESL